jgi:hypothetical protein
VRATSPVLAISGVCVALLVASLAACGGSAGDSGSEAPYGGIGFVGGVGPGVGFVGGGRGRHDGGTVADAGQEGTPDAHGATSSSSGGGASGGSSGGSSSGGGSSNGGSSSGGSSGASSSGVDAGDGGSTITINLPPGYFPSLDWSITGPAGSYSGTITYGAAHSLEFVVGGIQAGSGYTLTLRGMDPSGALCLGTSLPFAVSPGATTGVSVVIECFDGDGGARAADVTTGNVAVDAAVTTP